MTDPITSPGQYRKRPVVITAMQLPAEDADPSPAWIDQMHTFLRDADWQSEHDGGMSITTLEGVMYAAPGDWIIRGIKGEFYPCKPDIFAATYEPVTALAASAGRETAPPTSGVQIDFSCGCSEPMFLANGPTTLGRCDLHVDGRPVRLRPFWGDTRPSLRTARLPNHDVCRAGPADDSDGLRNRG